MESYIIYKKNSKLPYLCKTDGYSSISYSFRKKDVTTFLSREEAEKYYKKVINDEYSSNKKRLTNENWYGHSYNSIKSSNVSIKVRKRRIEFNKNLKEEIENKYILQPVGIGTRFLNIEKI